ncbi:MAG: DUF1634 domain-containing protein [Candidatus Omnitrophota bacterium]
MNTIGDKLANHKMEIFIGNLLRAGVIISASVVFFGGIIYIFRHGFALANYRVFQRVPVDLCSVSGIMKSVFFFRGRGFIQLGLLLLIATPIARVAFSIFAFARQRDTLYVIITLIVLIVLIYSLLSR